MSVISWEVWNCVWGRMRSQPSHDSFMTTLPLPLSPCKAPRDASTVGSVSFFLKLRLVLKDLCQTSNLVASIRVTILNLILLFYF